MPVSTTHNGDAGTVDFAVGFDYTSRGFVEVRLATVLQTLSTDYSFLNATTIRFVTPPPAVTGNIVFSRNTSSTPLVDFVAGASILDTDLDTATIQSMHRAEEAASEAYVDSRIAAAVITPSIAVSTWAQADILGATSDAAALTNLGLSAYSQTLLPLTTAAAYLATGLTIPGFTAALLLLATDAAYWRSSLGISAQVPLHQNALVNSDFQVWQHGPTFSSAVDGSYCADQWITLEDSAGGYWDWSQQTTDLPVGAQSAINAVESSNNVDFGLWQPVESAKTIPLRGKTVTISVDYKVNSGDLSLLQFGLISWEGTADAFGTGDIISAWNGALDVPTGITNITFVAPSTGSTVNMTGTSTWQTKSANFLVPAGANNIGFFLGSADSSHTAGANLSFSKFKIEEATSTIASATPYVSRTLEEEWRACERFFIKTFEPTVVPAQNTASHLGALVSKTSTDAASATVFTDWRFPARMVKTPVAVTYSWNNASTSWCIFSGGTFLAIVTPVVDTRKMFIHSAALAVAGVYYIHATANARIA